MKTGQAGINLIKQFEGCRLDAYKCPAGVWTIGYGHTGNVKQGDIITQAQAEAILIADLEKFEKNVNSFDAKYNWSQNEFDALVSFAFNIGSINQLTANGTRTKNVIAQKILEYNKAGGKVLSGLVKRRKAEQELFLMTVSAATTSYPTIKYGSTGIAVKSLQQILNAKGCMLAVDGIFGNKTLEAVKVFQEEHKLTVDGIVGTKTWDKLLGG